MYRQLLSYCLVLFAVGQGVTQNELALGTWRAHLPFQLGRYVTQSAEEVIYTTGSSLVFLSKEDGAPRFLDKTDGISGVDIDLIRYNTTGDYLLIAYSNSVFDIYQAGTISVFNQIRNFANLTGGRRINDVYFADADVAYLATAYGLSKVDVTSGDFLFTTFTADLAVSHVYVYEDHIYIATEEGYYRIAADAAFPEDFNLWERLDTDNGFPEEYGAGPMREWNGAFYLGIDRSIHRWQDGTLTPFFTDETERPLVYLTAEGSHLLAGYDYTASGQNGRAYYFSPEGDQGQLSPGCTGRPLYAVEDETGRIWFGDRYRNFRSVPGPTTDICTYRTFNSPLSDKSWDIAIDNDEVWITAGAISPQRTGQFFRDGVYRFAEGHWTNYNDQNTTAFKGMLPNDPADDFFDPISVAINTQTDKVYIGSHFEGIIEYDRAAETFVQYTYLNSPLEDNEGDAGRTYVGGVTVDAEGYVWVANREARTGKILHSLSPEGEWQSYSTSCGLQSVQDIIVDASGNKWMTTSDVAGVLVFNEGDPADASDNQCRAIRATNSQLPSNDARSLAVDLRGDVWVGTTAGVAIFECGNNVFNAGQCPGVRRIVERDGFGAFLLETETVQAIAVDGANRKWIGTTNGVFLLSDDGEEEIAHFNEDNSPLLDNVVRAIAINDRTGEVWFATDAGTVSYQSDAIVGTRNNKATIEVFPNPVRPDYFGPITVRGVARDANIKITDVSGKLVFETEALGGQITWNGTDYNGRRVQTGVYLVFSTSNARLSLDNPDAAVAKILFVN